MTGRRPLDDYPTPAWVTEAVLPYLGRLRGTPVLEPAIGLGGLARPLLACGARVSGIELDPDRAQAARLALGCPVLCADALAVLPTLVVPGGRPGLIVTNPPFRHALAFAKACVAVAGKRGRVALLARQAFAESQERAAFHRAHPSDMLVLPRRPSFTADGKVDRWAYAWFLFGPGYEGHWSVLPV